MAHPAFGAQPSLRAKSVEISFTPVDNQRWPTFAVRWMKTCDPSKTALEVTISAAARISGCPKRCANARSSRRAGLERLYAQAGHHGRSRRCPAGIGRSSASRRAAESAGETATLITRKGDLRGRTPRQIQYLQQIQSTTSPSASARPAPARPISPWPARSMRWSAIAVKRIVLVRPAVEAGERLGFLPGDWRRRSIRTCARCTTRSTT
jgi:phosphate starvation-inducible protein PhoH and related proteins